MFKTIIGGKLPATARRYLLALALLAGAFGISLIAGPFLGGRHPYSFFIPAALIAAWYGRFGPAMVVLVGGYLLADFFFAAPLYRLGPFTHQALVSILTYACITLIGVGILESFHRTRDNLRLSKEYNAALEKEIKVRQEAERALQAAQEQLHHHADELEKRVAERTVSLKASLKFLEGVMYHIAHDLRAPLRTMHGFTQLLMQNCGPHLDLNGQDHARRILAASQLLDEKIQSLLGYGRLGYQPIIWGSVDLSELVEQLATAYRNELKQRGGEFKVESGLPKVWGDVELVAQALKNIIQNAVLFVAPGTAPCIHVWARKESGTVRLYVRDNGIGIAPDYHEKIFGIFEKLDPPDIYPGTGMGLAIARKGIERIGGRIGVDSQPGKGSTFWIEFKSAAGELPNVSMPSLSEPNHLAA